VPAVVIARADDEIVDLIDRVRSSADPDVGLVVPTSSRALQTPLNVRLLAQFSHQSGRRTSIVTEDPRVQQLARSNGLQVYGSVPAYERGIELGGPRRVITQLPPARPPRGWDRRRFLYVAGAAVAIIGIVLFMALAPSARITVTIAATHLSAHSTIQGSTSATAATQPDHVLP